MYERSAIALKLESQERPTSSPCACRSPLAADAVPPTDARLHLYDSNGRTPAMPYAHACPCDAVRRQVPDLEVARLFYGEGLGLAADPSTSGAQRGGAHVVWYNCGRQQVRG